jgi:hypothetical protein
VLSKGLPKRKPFCFLLVTANFLLIPNFKYLNFKIKGKMPVLQAFSLI